MQRTRIDQWIRTLLWEGILLGITSPHHLSIHRTKGRIATSNKEQWIVQGVREVYEFKSLGLIQSSDPADPADSKLVLIGEGLHRHTIEHSLHTYLGV